MPAASKEVALDTLEELAQYGIVSDAGAPLIDVGSTKFLEFLQREVLDGLLPLGGATCKFFEGAYGSGKTHLLQLLRATALHQGLAVVSSDLSQTFGLEDWRLVVQHILQSIEVEIDGQRHKSLPRVVDALARTRTVSATRAVAAAPHPGFANALLLAYRNEIPNEDGKELLRKYLQGERVAVPELRRFGIRAVKDPLSSRNAEHVLTTVAMALQAFGVQGTLLLFDENEKTLAFRRSNPPRRIIVAANLLRRLVDHTVTGKTPGVLAVFAVLPGFIESCSLAYPALGQRLQITRGLDDTAAWRSPVLPVEGVSSQLGPEEFLRALIGRFEALAELCGGQSSDLRKSLEQSGTQILRENVGPSYKRDLVKKLSAVTLDSLN